MKTNVIVYYFGFALWNLWSTAVATNDCVELEFLNFQEDVYSPEDSYVDLKFYVTTSRCKKIHQTVLVKITTLENQEHIDVCLVQIDSGACLVSDASTSCYCTTRSGPVHFLFKVSLRDSGRIFRWLWGDQSSQMKHRVVKLHVDNAHRSTSLQIEGPSGLATDGSEEMRLACLASGFSPAPEITWEGVVCKAPSVHDNRVCTFTPTPPKDDGKKITCCASVTGKSTWTAKAAYFLNLTYPPLSAPVIEGIEVGQKLLEGQTVNLTCTVQGGKPPVGSVSFTCRYHTDNPDIVHGSSVSSSLTLGPLTAKHNGATCVCQTEWSDGTAVYRLNASTVLSVTDPKSDWKPSLVGPDTFITDGSEWMILTCEVADISVTPITWEGVTCRKSTKRFCPFQPAIPGDDGKVVTCSGVDGRNSSWNATANFTIDLSYPPLSAPVIEATAEGRTFHVGQNVTLTCTVTGGKPVVSLVKFNCTNHDDTMDFVNFSSVSSSVTFAPLTAEDDGVVCFCSATWVPSTHLYLKNNSFVLIVLDSTALHQVVIVVSASSVAVIVFAIGIVCFVVWYKKGRRNYEQPLPRLPSQERETQLYTTLKLRTGDVLVSKEEDNSYEEIPDSTRVSAGAEAINGSHKSQVSDPEIMGGSHIGDPGEKMLTSVTPERQDTLYLHPCT